MKKCETIFLLCDLMCVYRDRGDNTHRLFAFRYKNVSLVAEEGKYLVVTGGSYEDLEQEDGFRQYGKYVIIIGHGEEGRAEFFVEDVIWETDQLLEYLLEW